MEIQSRRRFVRTLLSQGRLFGFIALVGVVVLTSVSTAAAQQPSNRFSDLEDHIRGTDTMSVAELQSWATAFRGEAGSLGNRLSDFVAAVEVVELYEDVVGPIFTRQGQLSFANSWDGETNIRRASDRAMLGVYQAVFDAFNNNLVSQNTNLVNGVMFRATQGFPGTVPNPTNPFAVYEVQIDGTLNEEFGSDGGYNTLRRYLYLTLWWVLAIRFALVATHGI